MRKILVLIVSLLVCVCLNQVKAVIDDTSNVIVKDEKMLGADLVYGMEVVLVNL